MRLAYAPSDPPTVEASSSSESDATTVAISQLYASLLSQRPQGKFLPLDLTLLHSPGLAEGFYYMNRKLHSPSNDGLAPKSQKSLIEIAICRVAVLNGSSYGWNTHGMIALRSGVQPDTLKLLLRGPSEEKEFWVAKDEVGLTESEAAVLNYTDEVTRDVKVKDETFERLKEHLDNREIVELTTTIGMYNFVNRILVPLQVGLEDEAGGNARWKDVEELAEDTRKMMEAAGRKN